jgi:hypothetical protein
MVLHSPNKPTQAQPSFDHTPVPGSGGEKGAIKHPRTKPKLPDSCWMLPHGVG